jgi:hypothetical protein
MCEQDSVATDGKESTAPRYSGGYGKTTTWIHYTKQFADIINGCALLGAIN